MYEKHRFTDEDIKAGTSIIWAYLAGEAISPEDLEFGLLCRQALEMKYATGHLPTIEEAQRYSRRDRRPQGR